MEAVEHSFKDYWNTKESAWQVVDTGIQKCFVKFFKSFSLL